MLYYDTWTEEDKAKLIRLRSKGTSIRQIALELGRTACGGKEYAAAA